MSGTIGAASTLKGVLIVQREAIEGELMVSAGVTGDCCFPFPPPEGERNPAS
jgi:hypothetical protein